jgi:ATP/ADP translocase
VESDQGNKKQQQESQEMKRPVITVFLYMLGAISLIAGAAFFAAAIYDENGNEAIIGTSAITGGAVLIGLGSMISLLFKISNK